MLSRKFTIFISVNFRFCLSVLRFATLTANTQIVACLPTEKPLTTNDFTGYIHSKMADKR